MDASRLTTGLMWFRRDLRAQDNAALHHALRTCGRVHCVFVFDRAVLELLPRSDRRVEFIRDALVDLDAQLRRLAGAPEAGLIVRHAMAVDEIPRLARELSAQLVFANHDYEPRAIERDAKVRGALAGLGVALHTFKDHVIFGFFAEHLNDYDLASNNGGWQWASSSGCDAQPYFRIFNPVAQSRRFDPEGKFILRYLPQLAGLPPDALHAPWTATPLELAAAGVQLGGNYPAPIVDHTMAREQTLARYAAAMKAAG
ncbi:MAG: FAD-binding domain-containing protein [Ramlibacter sp.]